jgi:predicted transcriptional regulator
MTDINNGEKENLLKYPHFKKNSINLPTTYLKALEEMIERNINVLAIVDDNNQPRRIIERDEILGKIILDLAIDD